MGWLFDTVDTTTELMYFVPVLAGAFYVGARARCGSTGRSRSPTAAADGARNSGDGR